MGCEYIDICDPRHLYTRTSFDIPEPLPLEIDYLKLVSFTEKKFGYALSERIHPLAEHVEPVKLHFSKETSEDFDFSTEESKKILKFSLVNIEYLCRCLGKLLNACIQRRCIPVEFDLLFGRTLNKLDIYQDGIFLQNNGKFLSDVNSQNIAFMFLWKEILPTKGKEFKIILDEIEGVNREEIASLVANYEILYDVMAQKCLLIKKPSTASHL